MYMMYGENYEHTNLCATTGTLHSLTSRMTTPPQLTAADAPGAAALVTTAQFRAQLSDFVERANRQPVRIASRGVRPRAVLVSTDFFERACEALGDEVYSRPPLTAEEECRRVTLEILEDL